MNILENELLIKYDVKRQELETYRMIKDTNEKIIVTSYSIEKLLSKGIKESGRIIGEDILLLLTATREAFEMTD